MRKFAVLLCLCSFIILESFGQGTVQWTGANSNNWNDAGNWQIVSGTPMLPPAAETVGDYVIIPMSSNDPVVPNGVNAFARKLTINVGATLTVQVGGSLEVVSSDSDGVINYGTIENSGNFLIDSSYMHGLVNEFGGVFNNSSTGILDIYKGLGNRLRNMGVINNAFGGQFQVGGGVDIGGINFANGSIQNAGTFTIMGGDTSTFHNYGSVEISLGASFRVGMIPTGNGVYNAPGASILNNGDLEVKSIGGSDTIFVNLGSITCGEGSTLDASNTSANGFYNGLNAFLRSMGTVITSYIGDIGFDRFRFTNFGIAELDTLNTSYGSGPGIYNALNAEISIAGYLENRFSGSPNSFIQFYNNGVITINTNARMDLGHTPDSILVNDTNGTFVNSGAIEFWNSLGTALTNRGTFSNSDTFSLSLNHGGGGGFMNYNYLSADSTGVINLVGVRQPFFYNGLGDTMKIHCGLTGTTFGSDWFVYNEGFCEFYIGDDDITNRSNVFYNGVDGAFYLRDSFYFASLSTAISNWGKWYFEPGSAMTFIAISEIIYNQSSGEFYNYADIKGQNNSNGIRNDGKFVNYEGVEMDFVRVGGSLGVISNSSNAEFINDGLIKARIMNTNVVGNSGTFTNLENGFIDAGYSGNHAVENNATGNFSNFGTIMVNESGLDSIADHAVRNVGNFTNHGLIEVGYLSVLFGAEGVVNEGTFVNSGCGIINIKENNLVLDPANGFTNSGLIIENGDGDSDIETNEASGYVINLNGGNFNIATDNGTSATDVMSIDCAGCYADYMGYQACALITNAGDYEPDGFDPCACDDPNNIFLLEGGYQTVVRYHDYVNITDVLDREWRLHEVIAGDVLDATGNPLPVGAMGAVLVAMDIDGNPLPANQTRLDFYHNPDVGFTATFSPDGGTTILEFSNVCTSDCAVLAIPTLSDWGLMILSLSVLIVGIVGIRYRIKVMTA